MDQQRKFDPIEKRWYVKTGYGPFARWTPDPCNTEEKMCWTCKRVLGFDAFGKNRAKRDGMTTECRACKAARAAVYHRAQAERLRAKHAAWRAEYPEVVKALRDRYRCTHADEIKARKAEYERANRDKLNAKRRAWQAANREHYLARKRAEYQRRKRRQDGAMASHGRQHISIHIYA